MINRLRFIVIPLFLILQVLLPKTISAESFPAPGHQATTSLLGIPTRIAADSAELKRVIITIDGPRRLKLPVGTDDWDIRWFRVSPGSYSIHIDEGITAAVIDVPPGTIMVAPIRLVIKSEGTAQSIFVEPVDEEDRQKAALRLGLYYDFPEWYGREYAGFGSLRPTVEQEQTLFTATLTTDTPGAEVYLNDRLAGATPLELNLTGTKHKLLFRAEGREDVTRYIKLERDADIVIEMPIAVEQSSGKETFRTIVGPFFPKGEADEQLANLFADTLQITLEEDERLNVVREEIVWTDEQGIIYPDYSTIDEGGADLIVSGFFRKEGNQLTVLANLYDVQAESSKASFNWSGTIGLSIFDAMDEISESFMEDVDRYLPDAGRVLETRTEVLYKDTSREEYEIFRNSLVQNRWSDSRHSLSLFLGIGGGMEDIIVDNGSSQTDLFRYEGDSLSLSLEWTYDFNQYLAIGSGVTIIPKFNKSPDDQYYSETSSPIHDVGYYLGPRIFFRNLKTDLFFGLSAQVSWAPEYTQHWDDGGLQSGTVGSFLFLSMPFDIGFRFYFTERSDATPFFLNGRFTVNALSYRFDLSGRSANGFSIFSGLVQLGFGVRL